MKVTIEFTETQMLSLCNGAIAKGMSFNDYVLDVLFPVHSECLSVSDTALPVRASAKAQVQADVAPVTSPRAFDTSLVSAIGQFGSPTPGFSFCFERNFADNAAPQNPQSAAVPEADDGEAEPYEEVTEYQSEDEYKAAVANIDEDFF